MESNSELIREIELLEEELVQRVAAEKGRAESWRDEQLAELTAEFEQFKIELAEQKEEQLQSAILSVRQQIERPESGEKSNLTKIEALTSEQLTTAIARNIHLILPEQKP